MVREWHVLVLVQLLRDKGDALVVLTAPPFELHQRIALHNLLHDCWQDLALAVGPPGIERNVLTVDRINGGGQAAVCYSHHYGKKKMGLMPRSVVS